MPNRKSDRWIRVKDAETGHEYSIAASAVRDGVHEVIDKDSVDSNGHPLPPKPRVSKRARAAAPRGDAKSESGPSAEKEN